MTDPLGVDRVGVGVGVGVGVRCAVAAGLKCAPAVGRAVACVLVWAVVLPEADAFGELDGVTDGVIDGVTVTGAGVSDEHSG